jgi:hypothetical protein
MPAAYATWLLEQEARALLTRLARVKPFVLHEPHVPAAAFSVDAQSAIESKLARARRDLRARVHSFLAWLTSSAGRKTNAADAQRRFAFLRLRFNAVLSDFDTFADVLTQRSEHETGVWLAGLDVVAADALELPAALYDAPPVICYLDRGHGAAIRRARTRLPGGGENPVAIIRVPRERMVGSGIASSLVHEVGHQGAALLDMVESLRSELAGVQSRGDPDREIWSLWDRWLGEIVADLWSVSRVGISASIGLVGVVTLPRAFVFRVNIDDAHPIPWLRVLLSCAMGDALYPHDQWKRLAAVWTTLYPGDSPDVDARKRALLDALRNHMPDFVRFLVNHRPPALRGTRLGEAMTDPARHPAQLAAWIAGGLSFMRLREVAPSFAFAAVGQAKADGRITPEREARLLADLLTFWAMRRTLDTSRRLGRREPRRTADLAS